MTATHVTCGTTCLSQTPRPAVGVFTTAAPGHHCPARAGPHLKVLYLAVRNLEEFRGPNTGIRSSGWKQALQAFTIYFDGRIPTP